MKYAQQVQVAMERLDQTLAKLHNLIKQEFTVEEEL